MLKQAYYKGFLAKCAEYGVSPELLIKKAQQYPNRAALAGARGTQRLSGLTKDQRLKQMNDDAAGAARVRAENDAFARANGFTPENAAQLQRMGYSMAQIQGGDALRGEARQLAASNRGRPQDHIYSQEYANKWRGGNRRSIADAGYKGGNSNVMVSSVRRVPTERQQRQAFAANYRKQNGLDPNVAFTPQQKTELTNLWNARNGANTQVAGTPSAVTPPARKTAKGLLPGDVSVSMRRKTPDRNQAGRTIIAQNNAGNPLRYTGPRPMPSQGAQTMVASNPANSPFTTNGPFG